jgi:DNA-binding NtrC family response regulator
VGPGGRPPRLSREAEDVIVRFRWPGNVRQLATEAQRLAVKASAGVVEVGHLSAEVLEGPRVARGSLRRNREESDRACVREALEQHGGNRTAAAAHLGISRQALVSLMHRLDLRVPAARDRVRPAPSPDLESAT